MDTFVKTLDSLWQILVVGLLLGAGLPAVFAVGIRLLSAGETEDGTTKRRTTNTVAAGLCFAAVVVAIVVGILFIMKNFLAHDFGIHIF